MPTYLALNSSRWGLLIKAHTYYGVTGAKKRLLSHEVSEHTLHFAKPYAMVMMMVTMIYVTLNAKRISLL